MTHLTKKDNLGIENSRVYVYPDPVRDTLFIESLIDRINYTIFDISGILMLEGVGRKIDVSELPEGYYFIRVENKISGTSKLGKFVKEP